MPRPGRPPMTTVPEVRLPDALQHLRDLLAGAPLQLRTPGRDAAARAAASLVDQIDDYLLPRLRDLHAPLLAVVGGQRSARRDGAARTGWPVLRWRSRLRADPLARLHLGDERARTSLPLPGAVQQAAVGAGLRRARDAVGEGLPQAWRDELRRTAEDSERALPDRLDRAVAGTDLGPDRVPLWQRAVGGLQWLLLVVAVVGAVWLLALAVLGLLRLDDVVPLPRVQG